ncbi:hypothetical protein F53441_10537 [Fusarium austroafricanum]|uniref:Uncharacterized protein n=1 Tax=Fusarium austroafricanum TaxID=2364996 RepID=A0A8H4NUG0_9HYPO|nr:hypothetical protein F53441_10537 [Fusarium austroafricanum]
MEIRFKSPKAPPAQGILQTSDIKPSTLAFVHVNPTKAKDHATQRKIRRHVMKDIGRSRRLGVIQSEITSKPTHSVSIPAYWGDANVCVNFRRLFHAMDMVSEGLLSIAVIDPELKFKQRLAESFENPPSVGEIETYTESLGLVRRSITETEVNENAVIGTVICLAIFDMRVGNSESWMMHMSGLERLVELAGGVQQLDSRPAIRQSLFIADLLGSLIQDAKPRFPLPKSLPALPRATRSRYVQRLLTSFKDSDETAVAVIYGALGPASQLAVLLNQVWKNSRMKLDLLIPVCTLAHQVLSLPRMDIMRQDMSSLTIVAELVRISVISLISLIILQSSGDTIYVAARRDAPVKEFIVLMDDQIWTGRQELKLWVLVIQICIGIKIMG